MKTKELVLNAMMLAVLIVLSQLAIPIQPVPITLQTLAVMLIAILLSPKNGLITILAYIILGLAGLPIFANFSSGIQSLLSPSFGFILSWLVAVPIQSYYLRTRLTIHFSHLLTSCLLNFILTYSIALPYMAFILNHYLSNSFNFTQVLTVGLLPFIPGAIIKILLACWIGRRLYPAFNSRREK